MKIQRLLAPSFTLIVAAATLAPSVLAQKPTPVIQEPAPPKQEKVPTKQEAGALVQAGDFKAAAKAWGLIAAANPTDGQAIFMHGYALHGAGDLKAAHDRHLEAAEFPNFRPIALYNHACVHALWNEPDAAFVSLKEAMDAGFDNLMQLQTDSDMDSLREDARFKAILVKLSPKPILKDLAPERRFDFYVGEWEMRRDETVESLVSVVSAFGGRGLRVSIQDPADGRETANALYVYDSGRGQWKQTWMSADGQTITMVGGLEGGAMALRVESDSKGDALNGRSVFRAIEKDSFTYAWETTEDNGKTWSTVAERSFTRKG